MARSACPAQELERAVPFAEGRVQLAERHEDPGRAQVIALLLVGLE
jgi:hypothetical protein